jgi:hypothetical protein
VVELPCARVFMRWRREKSLPVCMSLTRCRLRVTPFLLGGRRGDPVYTVLYVPGETLGLVWSVQQRHIDGISLLDGAAWYGVL